MTTRQLGPHSTIQGDPLPEPIEAAAMSETPREIGESAMSDAVKVKPLVWVDYSGDGYTLFRAKSSFGDYVYGEDRENDAYWQGLPGEIEAKSLEAARQSAEADYERRAWEDFHATYTIDPAQPAGWQGGVRAIAAERQRQIEVEGWKSDHDDQHRSGEIAGAAACYIMHGLNIGNIVLARNVRGMVNSLWPWSLDWWKPKDRRSDLVRAGALIAAEIDRLDRATPPAQEGAGDE